MCSRLPRSFIGLSIKVHVGVIVIFEVYISNSHSIGDDYLHAARQALIDEILHHNLDLGIEKSYVVTSPVHKR